MEKNYSDSFEKTRLSVQQAECHHCQARPLKCKPDWLWYDQDKTGAKRGAGAQAGNEDAPELFQQILQTSGSQMFQALWNCCPGPSTGLSEEK